MIGSIMNEKKINNELEEQKKEFKKSIQELIEKSLLQEAEYMINESKRVMRDNLELTTFSLQSDKFYVYFMIQMVKQKISQVI